MSLLIALASVSHACSLAGPVTFFVDGDGTDTEAPDAPEVVDVVVDRGRGPEKNGLGGSSSTSCDDLGFITVELDQPGSEDVGYYLELVDGDLPEDLVLLDEAIEGPTLGLVWIDGATDDQEPLSFTLGIVPVDRDGNEGERVDVVIEDDGGSAKGCSTVGALPVSSALLLPLLATRRRR